MPLAPWMLIADWRDDAPVCVTVDLATWPADLLLAPLPPVPVIALGSRAHPQAGRADVLVEPPIGLDALVAGIVAAPLAAAALVRLLRAIEGLAPERALPLESFAFAMLQGGAEHARWLTRPHAPAAAPGVLRMRRSGNLLELTIDRPHARNAIDRAMRDALHEAFTLAALDPGIDRVRLRGAGRRFGMGADLAEFGTTRDPAAADAIRARTLPAHAIARCAAKVEAHVQGACIGASLELAAFAGRLAASRDAWFQMPEVAMGILPGFGGCVSIPARIGRQRAAALMLSGKRVRTDVALAWGLVDALVDDPAGDDRHADPMGREGAAHR